MIRSYPPAEAPWTGATWIDLCEATEQELSQVQEATKLRVPDKNAISEIESSSRVYTESGSMYLSTPLPASSDAAEPLSAVGFVLNEHVLISVRFSDNSVFDGLYQGCERGAPSSSCEVFVRILEALVDRSADKLEHCGVDLDAISHRAFHAERADRRARKMISEALHAALRKLGRLGDRVSQLRDTLLGLGRIAAFVSETGDTVLRHELLPRMKAIRADIVSLNDYQQHLSGKVQFLLDATLGFISIEQNDVVKTLTIVSVVGVPPVVVAGIYGMNFQFMPELQWHLGYPFALALMLVTGLLPLVWFKWRGWM